jgi:SSS family solute:Na+ symporter
MVLERRKRRIGMTYLILLLYLGLTFFLGYFYTRRQTSAESFFLSNRNLKTAALFFTLIATNFSAFFFLGFAGEAYQLGYGYYAMMAFGTSFAGLTFYVIGNKAWHLGKRKGYMTPVEMVRGETNSDLLSIVFMLCMCLFMIPFLAVQAIGGGLILETMTDGQISYHLGIALMTVFIVVYVLMGGMRGIVIMDIKNGIIMLSLMVAAFVVLGYSIGGIESVNTLLYREKPELFDPTADGFYTPLKWVSFLLLWTTCFPVFPQIFMRFLMGRDLRSFKKTTVIYTIIPPLLFIVPVTIGVMGHIDFPALGPRESDGVLPMLLYKYTPGAFSALILTGALAAFMSTVDSILIAISSIGTRDVYLRYIRPEAGQKQQVLVARWIVVILAAVGLLMAWYRPGSIFTMVTVTFSGSALLFPVLVAVFYWKKVSALACTLALVSGEILLFSLTFSEEMPGWMGSALPVLPAFIWTSVMIVVFQLLLGHQSSEASSLNRA